MEYSFYPLFYKSGILKLHDINTFQVACFMYKSIAGTLPVSFQSFFVLNNEIHNNRFPRFLLRNIKIFTRLFRMILTA